MNRTVRLTYIIILIAIILATTIIICIFSIKNNKTDCDSLKKDFDFYAERTNLPVRENPNSLCYGLEFGDNLSGLQPKWAVGKLISHEKGSYLDLEFQGDNKTMTITFPKKIDSPFYYRNGAYYKIDMNNVCKSFFMMLDSQDPSSYAATFTPPVKVRCK